MKFLNCLLILLFWTPSVVGHDLIGKIVDVNNEPIIGAYVNSLSTKKHTHSDEFGKFIIRDAHIGDSLKIMHLVYETKYVVLESIEEELLIKLSETYFELGEVVVNQSSKEVNIISAIDIQAAPVKSSQEILRKVPGLFIGQHAGGGKAEQIFLRGFDIDHGTDISLSVDGMPVNMVSHAHGQGYADLHFVIPETIEAIDFGKGPYYADEGNFATAGYVKFKTKDKIENSLVGVHAGRFNSMRAVGLFKLLDSEKKNAYIASEYTLTDGPFQASQHFSRYNVMGKYSSKLNDNSQFTGLISHFSSNWDASGQIPQRAVDQGLISRFGAIDSTEGGQTSRTNFALSFNRILSDHASLKNNVYYSLYNFELFSNFTYFLNDPTNGDQIRQKEERQLFGFESLYSHSSYFNNVTALFQFGIGMRNDLVKGNELSRTKNRRTTISSIQLGDVDEKNLYAFVKADLDVGKWLFEPVLRYDFFRFNYIDLLDTLYNNQFQSKGIFTPKFNIIYNANPSLQLFVKSGIGFHSNDTRVVLAQTAESILPAAYGVDVGAIMKPAKRMIANVAFWYLALDQEFVYVGDEGVVEPSGETKRLGIDLGLRYQVSNGLLLSGDFTYAYARSVNSNEGENFIPLAPIYTGTAGLNWKINKFNTVVQVRYLGDRAANEDNSITAKGYTITDLSFNYSVKNKTFGFAIENLFNQEWNETQFATESRLRNENTPIEEIHFTPGTPFFMKGTFTYLF